MALNHLSRIIIITIHFSNFTYKNTNEMGQIGVVFVCIDVRIVLNIIRNIYILILIFDLLINILKRRALILKAFSLLLLMLKHFYYSFHLFSPFFLCVRYDEARFVAGVC